MTVSILGCGWYGLPLGKHLAANGIRVKGSTTTVDKQATLAAEGIEPYLINLSSETDLPALFFKCDVLIVAIPPKARSGEGEDYLPKLNRVIDAITANHVHKVILISSTGIYADLKQVVDETSDPQPNTPAGLILKQAEELFGNKMGFETTVIRFGGLIGPGRDPGRFFAGKKDIPGGLAPINLIHLDDCIGITERVINRDAFGYTFNAVAPHHPTKNAFYGEAAARYGAEEPRFLMELGKWKIVSTIVADDILRYRYKVNNWHQWLR